MAFSILPCRVPPERSADGAVVYNLKLWVFAGYDGSKRSAFNHVLANLLVSLLVRDWSLFFFWGGGVAPKRKGLGKQNFE